MKLYELAERHQTEHVAKTIKSHMGHAVSFDNLNENRAKKMLAKVRGMLKEYKTSVSRHYSERNPAYLQLIMMEQALTAHISEQQPPAPAAPAAPSRPVMNDPKSKAVMDKVSRGQALTPDEQQTVNRIALAKETRKPKRMVKESEIQTAQVVLAAQDMVDRIQGMMEDISEMQFKDLPALVNSIRNDMGVDQATQFQTQASAALSNLLTAVQAGKTEMEAAQGVLTGQAPVVPGQDTDMPPAATAPGEEDMDLSLDANLPQGGEEEEEEEQISVGLGRERR